MVKRAMDLGGWAGLVGELGGDGFRMTHWIGGGKRVVGGGMERGNLMVWLNTGGTGELDVRERRVQLGPGEMAVAFDGAGRIAFEGRAGGILALEMRRAWVERWAPPGTEVLRRPVRAFLNGELTHDWETASAPAGVVVLVQQVENPPTGVGTLACWFHGKAMELAAHAVFAVEEELFCHRTRRVGRERVEQVKTILQENLEFPPALADLGRRVGCSPFYLSRIFKEESGETIPQYVRSLRLERAAEMLRRGEGNVTEAAMAVGYSSLSHFSKAFAKAFGCCPCLYGRK